jgi:hypothetical protein
VHSDSPPRPYWRPQPSPDESLPGTGKTPSVPPPWTKIRTFRKVGPNETRPNCSDLHCESLVAAMIIRNLQTDATSGVASAGTSWSPGSFHRHRCGQRRSNQLPRATAARDTSEPITDAHFVDASQPPEQVADAVASHVQRLA